MGFFQDLKEDISKAVDEMLPEENADATSEEELNALIKGEMAPEPVVEEEVAAPEPVEEVVAPKEPERETKKAKGDRFMNDFANEEVLDETAIITAGMTISGDIKSQGSLEIVGTVVGNVDILGKLNISGNIQGDSKAAEIFADSAKIVGEVHSSGSIKVGQSTVIIGNMTATSAVIAGAIKGDIDVKGPVILDSSAIVMGNIKSKSVQINNGAVIEGMCSQCYADVNPTAFFNDYK